ncbi:Transcription factor, fungi [Penicillium italicum]|uniref:Transcription factor, fungi n=1 Tax=Penicillium italicum TaxID=40296 RepID=A0A0A2KRL1_PENIT|nr:Transcription factor, fungi [Penicillium italicum]
MNVVTDLFMRTCDLLAVQALLGLAIFFPGTLNPQPLFMFVAAAVRLSQSIGLHNSSSFGLPESHIEERRRFFLDSVHFESRNLPEDQPPCCPRYPR